MKNYLLLFLLVRAFAYGQVSGKVVQIDTEEPLVGVKIECSTGEKTITDIDGKFYVSSISFPTNLVVSFVGYDTLRTSIPNQQTALILRLSPQVKSVGQVVITAGRRSQKIEEVPVSMEVIRPALIDNKGIVDLEQAVDQSPGVYAMDGQVSIRGGSGFAYGAGSRVLLLWNGTPLLAADAGDTKWNSIPMEQASQIEIMKGASSVLYGSGALNGIISLTEKEPTKKGETKIKIMGGIYDDPKRSSLKWWSTNPMFQQIEVFQGKMYEKFGYTLSATGYRNDGYRQGETEDRGRISGTLFFKPLKYPKLKYGLGYNLQIQKTGNFIIWQSDTLGYTPSGGADTSNAASTLTYNSGLRLSIDPYVKWTDKHQNKQQLKTRVYYIDNSNLNNPSQSSQSALNYVDYQFQHLRNKTNLTAGATYIRNWVQASLYGDHVSQNLATYLQGEHKIGKFDIIAGMRLEYFEQDGKRGDTDFYVGKDSTKLPFYPIFRTGIHYAAAKYTHIRASIGQGVRYPSVAERYTSTSVGSLNIFPNPNLQREVGWAAEIGIKQGVKLGEWKGFIDVAGFINQYSNMMEFTFNNYMPQGAIPSIDPNNPYYIMKWLGFRAENAEKARITGCEFSFNSSGKIKEVEVNTLLGYTYMNPISLNADTNYLKTFSDTNGHVLKYRFKHLAKADIEINYKRLSFGFSSRYNSFMSNIDAIFEQGVLGTELLPGLKTYRQQNNSGTVVFDLRFGWKVHETIRLGCMLNNMFNLEYSTRPGDIQAPRNLLLQAQIKL